MSVHVLKSWPDSFGKILNNKIRAEIRRDDRRFQNGDELRFEEFAPGSTAGSGYTGAKMEAYITRLLRPGDREPESLGIREGFCLIHFVVVSRTPK